MSEKKNYLNVVYNEQDRPFTSYPTKLSKYLFDTFDLKKGQSILDVGCGRGEFLYGFMLCGLVPYAVDQISLAKELYNEINFKNCDLSKDKLPYEDETFDVVFSKSVIEHFYYPEKILLEMKRVLKKNGKIITMTPDWELNFKNFYEDYTHRTPFSATSLKDFHLINGFSNIKVKKFKQLPILWKKKNLVTNMLRIFSEITRIMVPNYFKKYKWVKFSKEIILLSVATK